ncbi:unnamed protein product [Cyprideis torosa]|uniref:Mediator of RNA polymerase II transcription subunit 16 n=1 Tax=Cyprideis torosa TaxID=163714 RepID=A0A7R8WE62_9CRUS|nr:unnamed protein product [Cyprideis torosa]CAG0895486.1 unnamed protein product [Cyprideis torosa]
MQLTYSVQFPDAGWERQKTAWFPWSAGTLSISSRNIIAISSAAPLVYSSTTSTDNDIDKFHDFQHQVYIADLNSPWDLIFVCSMPGSVTCLSWDDPGSRLAILDGQGNLKIFVIKDFLLSQHVEIHSASYELEIFRAWIWFRPGRKIPFGYPSPSSAGSAAEFGSLQPTAKAPINDVMSPTCQLHGGQALVGGLGITGTGLIAGVSIPISGDPTNMTTGLIHREAIDSVSWTYCRDGSIMVVSRHASSPFLTAHRITVSCSQPTGRVVVEASPLPILYPPLDSMDEGLEILAFTFSSRDEASFLLVSYCMSSHDSSTEPYRLAVLKLGRKQVRLDPIFLELHQQEEAKKVAAMAAAKSHAADDDLGAGGASESPPPHDVTNATASAGAAATKKDESDLVFTKQEWELVYTLPLATSMYPLLLATPLSPVAPPTCPQLASTNATPVVMVTRDPVLTSASVALLALKPDGSLAEICSRSHQQGHKVVPAFRQQRRLPTFHSAAFSWNGTCCILLDRFGTMFVYDVTSNHPLTGGGGEVEVASSSAFASLLESSLVLGLDSLDVLVTLKPTMATEVAEKLNESLCKQPQSIQDFYRIVAMILRMNLLKMSPLASSKATSGALHTLILLHSVAAAFRGTLRPSDLPTSQGPAEALAELLSKGTSDQSNDLNKVCCQLEPREFSVEGATLQSLQPLIQWVGDLALTLVLSAPHINSSVASPATELLKNRAALNIIRELLVVIRLWGYLRSSCLPNFSTADCHIQALNILFRILSRLALSTGWEHDDAFLDECNSLRSLSSSEMSLGFTPQGILALLPSASMPLKFEYRTTPATLQNASAHIFASYFGGASPQPGKRDVVRHVHVVGKGNGPIRDHVVGKGNVPIRECTRCKAESYLYSFSRTAATRSWDHRWAKSCVCGGHWLHRRVASTS